MIHYFFYLLSLICKLLSLALSRLFGQELLIISHFIYLLLKMLKSLCTYGRRILCLIFMVNRFLLLQKATAFSLEFNSSRCMQKERHALHNMNPECADYYYHHLHHDCCNWPGIYCSNLTDRIQKLDTGIFLADCLVRNDWQVHLDPSLLALDDLLDLKLDITGEYPTAGSAALPSFIGSFPKLRYLFLCPEYGLAIPPQFSNLTRLEILEVCPYSNVMVKSFVMFSNLTSLKRLALAGAYFSEAGNWVSVVSNLPHLRHLDLNSCNLPDVIAHPFSVSNSSKSLVFLDLSSNLLQVSSSWYWVFNHSSIVSLSLANNQLTGPIPNRFRMTNLSYLDLSYNNFVGKLPPSMKTLCSLHRLDISGNHLNGDLSSVFQTLSCAKKSLKFLTLTGNSFSGSVPEFVMFSSLRELHVSDNRLNGSLPSAIEGPSNLTILHLQHNQLVGSLLDISGLRSLEELQLQNNNLNGSIHAGLGRLSRLVHLDISSNSLRGEIGAAHLSNLYSLSYLDLSFNSLAFNLSNSWVPPFRLGTIGLASCRLGPHFPEWLRTQSNYTKLDMSNSGISGSIPFWFWNLSSLVTSISLSHNSIHGTLHASTFEHSYDLSIDLSSNFLEGTAPLSFGKAGYLNLSRNSLSGSVSFLCNGSNKLGIDLSHNFLSGQLPDCWDFWELGVLDLSNNFFSGQLPTSLGSLSGLLSLHLRDNMFSGELPSSLCKLTNLIYLDIGDNLLSGEIPRCMGHMLSNLTALSIRNNSVSGRIPAELCHSSSIQILDLSMNNLSGGIPKCLCNLKAMTQKKSQSVVIYDSNGTFSTIGAPYRDYISLVLKGYLYKDANHLELVKSMDLSSNDLIGEIPDEISCLTGLIFLNLSRNNLSGFITSKIGSLRFLESLDLSNNHLSGAIPESLSELNFLGTLNLADNLSGRIPAGTQLQGFSTSMFAGNPGLCGDPLHRKCPGDEGGKADGINIDDHNHEEDEDTIPQLGLFISIAMGFITGFWGICGSLVCKRSWRNAYFRIWIHAYDRLYVFVALMVVRSRRLCQD